MMSLSALRSAAVAGLLAAVVVLPGCSTGSGTDSFQGQEVQFTACTDQCQGEIGGAEYQILMPEKWNGTLLLYSHGYRSAFPTPPDNAPVQTGAEPVPGYSEGKRALADELLARGYALAGSGYSANGWAVAEGIKANKALYEHFAKTVATPQRVYLWGDSLGGLITEKLAESKPDWVTAAAPLCAPMAGLVPNMDLGLDVAVAYRTLLDPGFKVSGYQSEQEANAAFQRAAARIQEAAKAGGRDAAALLAMTAVVDANPKTANFDGRDAASRVSGAAESALIALAFSTGARYEAEQRFGGQFASNAGVDYSARLSELDRAWIDKVGGDGTAAAFVKALDAASPVPADPSARKQAAKSRAEGEVAVPTIAVHTAADPLVLVQNQSVLAELAARNGANEDLMQLYSVPPRRFATEGPAPYGAGHCNFTKATRVGVIELLDDWVGTGKRPTPEQVAAAMPESGIDPGYQPPAWPVGPDATNPAATSSGGAGAGS